MSPPTATDDDSPRRLSRLRGEPQPPHDERAARRAWEHAWGIKVGAHYPCLTRQLTRRRCPGDGCCWQADHRRPAAFDHVYAITRLSDRRRGVLTMPYGLAGSDAVDLARWCRDRGCRFTVLGEGWHFPGTVAVVIFPVAPGTHSSDVTPPTSPDDPTT